MKKLIALIGATTIALSFANTAQAAEVVVMKFQADDCQSCKYVGLTGFAAVVDKKSRRTIGCVNENYDASQVAELIKRAARIPHRSAASVRVDNFKCPPAHNKLP